MKNKEKLRGIKIYISKTIEHRFRKAAMSTYGYGKGALSQAGEAAFAHWSNCASVAREADDLDPIEAIEGMLSHIKKNSVTVQHNIRDIRAKRAMHYAKKK